EPEEGEKTGDTPGDPELLPREADERSHGVHEAHDEEGEDDREDTGVCRHVRSAISRRGRRHSHPGEDRNSSRPPEGAVTARPSCNSVTRDLSVRLLPVGRSGSIVPLLAAALLIPGATVRAAGSTAYSSVDPFIGTAGDG